MVSAFAHKYSRAILGRHPGKVEDNIANLCPPLIPSTGELRSLSARMEDRNEEIRHVEAAIADLEARLQRLFIRRDRLRTQNSVARAVLVSEMISGGSIEDDMSILSTDHVPDKTEAKEIKLRLDARRQHIHCMEDAIYSGDMDNALRNRLRSRVAILEQSCTVGQALLAPIRRLPAELLGEIFAQAVPSLNLDPLLFDHFHREFPFRSHERHPADVRSRISQVCNKWNRVAQATPQVWRTLALNFPLPLDISRIARSLRNSKACKLDVYVWVSQWFKPPDAALVPQVLGMIREELPRIRVFASRDDTQEYLQSLFPPGIHSRAPVMEIFSVEQFPPHRGGMRIGSIEAPSLHMLELRGAAQSLASFVPASLRQLRRLTISCVGTPASWAVWLKVFSNCPRLEVLHLNLCVLDPYEPTVGVTLPTLQEIVIWSEDPIAVTQALNSLRFQALTSFVVSCLENPVRPFISDVLDSLPDEVAASLRYFELNGVSFTGPSAARGLKRLTKVEHIGIYESDLDDIFFTTLLPPSPPGSASWPCPELRDLQLERDNILGPELIGLIDTRTVPDDVEPKSHHLTSVGVRWCYGLEPSHIECLQEFGRTHAKTLEFVP